MTRDEAIKNYLLKIDEDLQVIIQVCDASVQRGIFGRTQDVVKLHEAVSHVDWLIKSMKEDYADSGNSI